jgi:hypothetical protein
MLLNEIGSESLAWFIWRRIGSNSELLWTW